MSPSNVWIRRFSERRPSETTVGVGHAGQAVSDSLRPLCWGTGDRTNSPEQIAPLDEIQNPPGPGQKKILAPGLQSHIIKAG